MPRDLPDWGALSAQSTVHEVTDLGELAVRLGSIVSFDRRGDVVWLDDFESSLNKWFTSSSGAGGGVSASLTYARNGQTSALLTAGSDAAAIATMEHSLPFPHLSRFGFEASESHPLDTDIIDYFIDLFDGSTKTEFVIRQRIVINDVQYQDENGVFVTFTTTPTILASFTFFNASKIVVDFTSKEYVRLILNNVEYDLSGIAAKESASVSRAQLIVRIRNIGREGNNDKVYVDDVIVTQNEPV